MAKKKTLAEVLGKYESGKTLSKKDCAVIINAIYDEFKATRTKRTDFVMILIRNAETIVEKQGRPFSDNELHDYTGIAFCNNHTAKMAGMESLSTNNKLNKRCEHNKHCKGSICEHCFADKQIDTFTSMDKGLTLNYIILNFTILPLSILPIINRQFFRIESFGDVETVFQAINYCNLMTAQTLNNFVQFGAWSKNPDIWYSAFQKVGKPANLSFGVSSLYMNKVTAVSAKYRDYIDFVFTVFETEADALAAGYEVNCGARHCLSCLRCYRAHAVKMETGKIVQCIELKK